MKIECRYIDTCLPDYLQDHHNRDNEQLICFPVDNETTVKELADGLYDDVMGALCFDIPESISDNDIRAAINSMFEHIDGDVFDDSLPMYDENDNDSVYVYAVLSWDMDPLLLSEYCEDCYKETEDARGITLCPIHAAAPELREALGGLFEHVAMIHKHWGDGDNTAECNAAIAYARAAMDAATEKNKGGE